jgi:hypothetical protein
VIFGHPCNDANMGGMERLHSSYVRSMYQTISDIGANIAGRDVREEKVAACSDKREST